MRYSKSKIIEAQLGWENFQKEVFRLYTENAMSANEIAELIKQNLPKISADAVMTPRSISRFIVMEGKTMGITKATRTQKDSFQNAIRRGRVHWAYKSQKIKRPGMNKRLRWEILKRDGFKCVLCGKTAKDDLLEVDHILAWSKGGLTVAENLRTLCNTCNQGKRIVEKEKPKENNGFVSGQGKGNDWEEEALKRLKA